MFRAMEQKRNYFKKTLSVIGRIGAVLLANLIIIVFALYMAMLIVAKGPSKTARELFVLSVNETSLAGFLSNIFLSKEEVDEILAIKENAASGEIKSGEITNPSMIKVDTKDSNDEDKTGVSPVKDPTEGIETIEIHTDTYKGMLMIVNDPKRVFVGVPDAYGEDRIGLSLRQMIEKYDAIGGVNAGGFLDPGGVGKGGVPMGIVIKDSKIMWGEEDTKYSITGFDKDGVLYVGSMTGKEALAAGIVDAVSFGPALVINGEPVNSDYALGISRNPRTAIAQRADGSILLLVIEGRSLSSFGATFDDLIEIFMTYGAVNATNLDGGYSSLMVYNGGELTTNAYAYGERILPTAILVK